MIDRLAVALCTAVFAALTLLAWGLMLVVIFGNQNDDLGVIRFVTRTVFSQTGIAIVGGAALLGFLIGGDRMVTIFSVFWGTHPVWARFNGWLQEKSEVLNESREVSPWIVAAVLVLTGVGLWLWVAP